jgi:transposase
MIDRTSISAIAAELSVSWHTVSSIAMRATAGLVAAAGPDRMAGVRVIGVDEHRWAPRRIGAAGFVTLIIDLTPTHDHSGPARLLDLVSGRSAIALATWLSAQPADFAAGVEVVAMDGFAGYKTAATEVIPDAVTVMDPFHVVALAGTKLDLIRQRIQQQTLGRRGHTGDPLYGIRPTARTRLQLLSARQYARLSSVFDADEHLAVKVAWLIYQKIIAAYADPNRRRGKKAMTVLINSIRRAVPAGLEEIAGSAAPYGAAATTSWRSSTITPPTGPPRPSTVDSKRCAETPWDSGTSPTTAGAHSYTAELSTNSSMHSKLRRARFLEAAGSRCTVLAVLAGTTGRYYLIAATTNCVDTDTNRSAVAAVLSMRQTIHHLPGSTGVQSPARALSGLSLARNKGPVRCRFCH